MRVFVDDGNRHTSSSGYGALSRAILLSLKRHTDFQISIKTRESQWDDGIPHKTELLEIDESSSAAGADIALRIGTPESNRHYGIPTVVYTQNALGDLKPEWVAALSSADAVIVPSEFDKQIFDRYFQRVFVCHQYVDPGVFKPYPIYRAEGSETFTFLFVGSYSYRKGVDLLYPAFQEAFGNGERVRLHFHCFTGLEKDNINHLIESCRMLPSNIEITAFNGTRNPAWMTRIYNRADCVISLSRGEGWCMPLHEALLCERPVIASDSTAMGEMLPHDGVLRVKTREQVISSIVDPFGQSMRRRYGFSQNMCYEPEISSAASAVKFALHNYDELQASTKAARSEIIGRFSLPSMATLISNALLSTLGDLEFSGGAPNSPHR